MNKLLLLAIVFCAQFVAHSAQACSCLPRPENSALFSRADILVQAEITRVLKLEVIGEQTQKVPTQVEAKILRVYKGSSKLVGKSVTLTGTHLRDTCVSLPPHKIGLRLTLQGPEPYQWNGGCSYVWEPENPSQESQKVEKTQ